MNEILLAGCTPNNHSRACFAPPKMKVLPWRDATGRSKGFGGLNPAPQHEPMGPDFEPPTVAFEHAQQPDRTGRIEP